MQPLNEHKAPEVLGVSPLDDTLRWFKEAVPTPTSTTLSVQMGVHFEEVTEHLDCVMGNHQVAAMNVLQAKDALKRLADDMKANPDDYGIHHEDRQELLDALCDQLVTAAGTGYMLGFDITAALHEVNRSNYSKFEDGKAVFTEQGKIKKGKDFFRPDLAQFV